MPWITDERKTMSQLQSVARVSPDEAARVMTIWNECQDAREFACGVPADVMDAMMDPDAQVLCGAGRSERTEGRVNGRNGYRPRTPKTAVGDVTLRIPKLREGICFPDQMPKRWSGVDLSVAAIVRETCVCDVSTRKVQRVAERLGISSLSSSEASRLCDSPDAEVAQMRQRDLSSMPCCHLWLDATCMSRRDGSAVASKGMATAIGPGRDSRKHFPGADAVDTESEACWCDFLEGLKRRGLAGVRLVTSDDRADLAAAMGRVFQGCSWRRRVTRLERNLRSQMAGKGEDRRRAVASLVHAACHQQDPELAHYTWQEGQPWVEGASKRAGEVFSRAEESALAFMAFPAEHWAKTRTNNVQERANREVKRRRRVVRVSPSVTSMVRLTCASIMETQGRWALRRVFCEESAQKGLLKPEPSVPMSDSREHALEMRATRIVEEIAGRYGLKEE